MENTEIVKILIVNTGATPVSTEKMDFSASNKDGLQQFILDAINRVGKQSHALLKYKDKFWVAEHTARKGYSKEYHKHAVHYHPYMKELA